MAISATSGTKANTTTTATSSKSTTQMSGMSMPTDPLNPPPTGSVGAKLLADGSFGPQLKKNGAQTLKIDDGKGFGGLAGRKQNANDKKQNQYSTTDANFNRTLGVLKNDPDTGKPMNYVQDIQSYSAAGYIKTFHPDVYTKLVAEQNAGRGTVLGASLALLGVVKTADPSMAGAGLTVGQFANESVPGTNGAMNAKAAVMDPKDESGQDWARPHHAESHWYVYKSLMDTGKVDWQTAQMLSGDDAISGSGRINGVNGQDGSTGLNADERAVFKLGADIEQQTGADIIGIMMRGHNHLMLDESAMTDPKINKIIGFPKNARDDSPERANAVYQALLAGKVGFGNDAQSKIHKFDTNPKGSYANANGTPSQIDALVSQYPDVKETKHDHTATQAGGGTAAANDAGAGTAALDGNGALGGGGAVDALGGAAGLAGILQALQAIVAQLTQLIQALVSGTLGGGPGQAPGQLPGQTPGQDAMAGCDMMGGATPPKASALQTAQTGATTVQAGGTTTQMPAGMKM